MTGSIEYLGMAGQENWGKEEARRAIIKKTKSKVCSKQYMPQGTKKFVRNVSSSCQDWGVMRPWEPGT